MVGVARIELATPAMSTQCSTTELHAHRTLRPSEHLGGTTTGRNHVLSERWGRFPARASGARVACSRLSPAFEKKLCNQAQCSSTGSGGRPPRGEIE